MHALELMHSRLLTQLCMAGCNGFGCMCWLAVLCMCSVDQSQYRYQSNQHGWLRAFAYCGTSSVCLERNQFLTRRKVHITSIAITPRKTCDLGTRHESSIVQGISWSSLPVYQASSHVRCTSLHQRTLRQPAPCCSNRVQACQAALPGHVQPPTMCAHHPRRMYCHMPREHNSSLTERTATYHRKPTCNSCCHKPATTQRSRQDPAQPATFTKIYSQMSDMQFLPHSPTSRCGTPPLG